MLLELLGYRRKGQRGDNRNACIHPGNGSDSTTKIGINPATLKIDILDIAHRLSICNRWAGASTRFPVSVAVHSILVAQILPRHLKLWGLLHDAAEAYTGDLLSPLKSHCPQLKTLDLTIQAEICAAFGLTWPEPPEVKAADLAVTAAELAQVVTLSSWPRPAPCTPAKVLVPQMQWEVARWCFLKTFDGLNDMNSKEVMRHLEKNGWEKKRTKGDHVTYKHKDKPEIITIMHPMKDVPVYLIKEIERLTQTRLQQLSRKEQLAMKRQKDRGRGI